MEYIIVSEIELIEGNLYPDSLDNRDIVLDSKEDRDQALELFKNK